MDTAVLIWIIVGVIVLAIIVVVTLALTAKGRTEKRRRAEHEKAEKLRAEARETELAARESEARAAQTRADAASAAAAAQQAQAQAAQADVDARRLADSVSEHDAEAAKRREEQQETLRRADDVDPYVTTDAGRDERGARDADRDGVPDRDEAAAHSARDTDRDGARDTDRDGVPDRDERVAANEVPPAPDGVTGRAAGTTGERSGHDEPAITRPRATTGEVRTDAATDTAPPRRRPDNV
ncbi:hypothetical protein [Microbacterium sp. HJ5]